MISKLNISHYERLEELRIESISESPTFYGTSPGEQDSILKYNYNDDLFVLGFFVSDLIVAMCALNKFQSQKRQHKCTLQAVFVKKEYRRQGIAKTLLDDCTEFARTEMNMKKILTSAVSHNTNSISLYKKLGFREYGIEREAFYYKNAYYDEILLEKKLG